MASCFTLGLFKSRHWFSGIPTPAFLLLYGFMSLADAGFRALRQSEATDPNSSPRCVHERYKLEVCPEAAAALESMGQFRPQAIARSFCPGNWCAGSWLLFCQQAHGFGFRLRHSHLPESGIGGYTGCGLTAAGSKLERSE